MKVLISGANGFLGSHIVEKSLLENYATTAIIREGSDTSNLEEIKGYEHFSLDYSSVESIISGLNQLPKQDLIIHNAGLTKSYTWDGYKKVNIDLTCRFIQAIKKSSITHEQTKFAYISSLAAKGPVGNNGPASNYGRSKLKAEEVVKDSGLNWMIFRPTGIYGERDVQFVPLIKAVKMGLYPLMTSNKHKMTMIHAGDVARNVILCSLAHNQEVVHLEDGSVYEHKDLKKILESTLNKKAINLKVSPPIVKTALCLSDIVDRTFNRTPMLSREHYSEISQDWDYDFSEERKRIPLTIETSLADGFKRAYAYYKKKNLI